jgi:hypothetical protein
MKPHPIPAVLALIAGSLAPACVQVLDVDSLTFAPGPAGIACAVDSDCTTGLCSGGTCKATAGDGGTDAGADGGCSAVAPWSPPMTVSTVPGADAVLTVQMNWTGDGGAVNLAVCKTSMFDNPEIRVHLVNNARGHYGLVIFDGSLPRNTPCTSPGALMKIDGFAVGDELGGNVTIVSPDWAYSYWGDGCTAGGGMGDCWTGPTNTMTRTCF